MAKAAIYHFSNSTGERTYVYEKQIAELKMFASSLGYDVPDEDIYFDKSLLRCEGHNFKRLLNECDKYEALIVKDFYHINRNTGSCMTSMIHFQKKGLAVHTLLDGDFVLSEPAFDKPLRVATYDCITGEPYKYDEIASVNDERFNVFCKLKTKWKICGEYRDHCKNQNNGEQVQMMELIKNRDKYDIVLIINLCDIHWRTCDFVKIRRQLNLDIYSLQEGLLPKNTRKGIKL